MSRPKSDRTQTITRESHTLRPTSPASPTRAAPWVGLRPTHPGWDRRGRPHRGLPRCMREAQRRRVAAWRPDGQAREARRAAWTRHASGAACQALRCTPRAHSLTEIRPDGLRSCATAGAGGARPDCAAARKSNAARHLAPLRQPQPSQQPRGGLKDCDRVRRQIRAKQESDRAASRKASRSDASDRQQGSRASGPQGPKHESPAISTSRWSPRLRPASSSVSGPPSAWWRCPRRRRARR
jgi:hypothetical protein